jgi:hypothetical protein
MGPKKPRSKTELRAMKAKLRAQNRVSESAVGVVVDEFEPIEQVEVPIESSQSEPSNVVMISQSDPTSIRDSETMDPVSLDPDRNGSRTKNVDSQKGCAAEASLPNVPLLLQLGSVQMTSAEELNIAVARSLEEEVILENCTDSERGGVTIAESRDEPPRVVKRLSIASYRSPGLWISADDPTGRALHMLVDSLSVKAEGVVKKLRGSPMGKRGEDMVLR